MVFGKINLVPKCNNCSTSFGRLVKCVALVKNWCPCTRQNLTCEGMGYGDSHFNVTTKFSFGDDPQIPDCHASYLQLLALGNSNSLYNEITKPTTLICTCKSKQHKYHAIIDIILTTIGPSSTSVCTTTHQVTQI